MRANPARRAALLLVQVLGGESGEVASDVAGAVDVGSVAAVCGTSLTSRSFVFSYQPDGSRPWRPDGVTHRWTKWRRKADLDHVRLHDLRHFMATTILTAGVPVSVVAGRLGHARSATTLNVYSHFVEAGDQAAADLLAGMFAANHNGEVGQLLNSATGTAERPDE